MSETTFLPEVAAEKTTARRTTLRRGEPETKFMVQVLERRACGNLWPVATAQIESGGATTFTGDARIAFGPLLASTQKAASVMVLRNLQHALTAKQALQEELAHEGGDA